MKKDPEEPRPPSGDGTPGDGGEWRRPPFRLGGRLLLGLIRKAVVAVFGAILIACLLVGAAFLTHPHLLFQVGYRFDLFVLRQVVEFNHPPFPPATLERWDREMKRLWEDLREIHLDHSQVTLRFFQLLALPGESANFFESFNSRFAVGQHPFPLFFLPFSEGVFLFRHAPGLPLKPGAKLFAIDGQEVDRLVGRMAAIFPGENPAFFQKATPFFLRSAPLLHLLGITRRPDVATFTFEVAGSSGRTQSVAVRAARGIPETFKAPTAIPETLDPTRRERKYWLRFYPAERTLYVQFSSCSHRPDLPFYEFSDRVGEELEKPGRDHLILDVRLNGGGSDHVFSPLLYRLRTHPRINQRGRLFCLIGEQTYAAVLVNLAQLRAETQTIFIGLPTAGKPNHCGQARGFLLPFSGLKGRVATRKIELYPGSDPASFFPDLGFENRAADFFAGRDRLLERVLEWCIAETFVPLATGSNRVKK